MGDEQGLAFLNEGLDGRTEYRFYWDRNVLAIWFYVGADRKRKTTSLARPQALTKEFRAEARRRATEIVLRERNGRVLEATADERVQVTSTLDELAEAWLKEQARAYPDSIKTRRIQLQNVVRIFNGFDDAHTPLQRMVADRGPQLFVNERMRQVSKETVMKEVGILFQFLTWLEDKRFITKVPARPKYRPKDLGTRVGPQRAEPVPLSDELALQIIMRLPEYASRGGRKDVAGAKLPANAFVCRDWMRFAFEMALRPSTVARLRAGVHWTRGSDVLRITPDIDKGRNLGQARKVRTLPLTRVAKAILERHAPESGIIFGKPDGKPHDIRVQWKRAAIAVLGEDLGRQCAPYDLRHSGITRMRDLGTLTGTMLMAGHSKGTTTDKYTHADQKAAVEIVRRLDARNAELERKFVRKSVRKRSVRVEIDA